MEFTEKGVKIQYSIAEKTREVAATVAMGALTVWSIVGAVVFVISIIKELTEDNTVQEALGKLQRQIDEIKAVVTILDERVEELVLGQALNANEPKLRTLLDIGDEIHKIQMRLHDRPDDIDTAVDAANDSGVEADKFLRPLDTNTDYDLWRWADVVLDWRGEGDNRRLESEVARNHFKNMPTLPFYILALLTWLVAREKVVRAGQGSRLADDATRLQRHLAAVSIREWFDKYSEREDYYLPQSIAENIKYRIRAYATSEHKYSENNNCRYYYEVGSVMSGYSQFSQSFDIHVQENGVLCALPSDIFGTPGEELRLEEEAGLPVLEQLARVLGDVAIGRPLREANADPVYWPFPNTEIYSPAWLYMVTLSGDLNWWCNYDASRPGGSAELTGPRKVKDGWGRHIRTFNGGGQSIYYVDSTGRLYGMKHKGLVEGKDDWSDPKALTSNWHMFRHVFSGGENILYAIDNDYRLLWCKHSGGPLSDALSDWKVILPDWPDYRMVFSGGGGTIYGLTPGSLYLYRHPGYLDGNNDMDNGCYHIASYWHSYVHVAAAPHDVFYALTDGGDLHWLRYTGVGWEGPITMARGIPGCKAMFTGLLGVPTGVS